MAVTKAYTTEAKIESYLNISIATGAADDAINAAVAIIDQFTGRNFIADSTASARVYAGSGNQLLPIDDCVEITLVERGLDSYGDAFETITAGGYSGYYLHPANYAADKVPIRGVHLRDKRWMPGVQNNRITAKWGYSAAVPDDVSFAATVLAAGIYNANRGGGGTGNIKSERIGNYQVTYSDQEGWDEFNRAMQILQTRKKMLL